MMRLSDWLHRIVSLSKEMDPFIKGACSDHRLLTNGDCFLALEGQTVHGKYYLNLAIEQGAVAVLCFCSQTVEYSFKPYRYRHWTIPYITLPNQSELLESLLYNLYTASDLPTLIGVTGTNGKSSITHYMAQATKALGSQMAVSGTLGYGFLNNLQKNYNTTAPLSVLLYQLALLKKQQARVVALEVSSHGLVQGRVKRLCFKTAVFTNLTQDHLDYHGNMENYFLAKRQLFLSDNLRYAIINRDDPYGRRLLSDRSIVAHKVSYAVKDTCADVCVTRWLKQGSICCVNLKSPWGTATINLSLSGEFNIANALATIIALVLEGFAFQEVCQAMSVLRPICGRMQGYYKINSPEVMIDFAHSPDALKKVLATLRLQVSGRLVVLFGCGGERDQEKRSLMGAVATMADEIWLTADNPRSEEVEQIMKDIERGITVNNIVHKEADRAKAIRQALSILSDGDLLLIAGKGHETYQDIAGQKIKYSDQNTVEQLGYKEQVLCQV